MAYTPELNQRYSGSLRRIAWAAGMPMTKTMEAILDHFGKIADRQKICEKCRDDRFCENCIFNGTV